MPFEEFDEQSDQREYQEEVNQPSECVRGNHTRRPNDENQDGEYHRHGCCPDPWSKAQYPPGDNPRPI